MEALVGLWKSVNMPEPRPKRTTRSSVNLKNYYTCDNNGEWIFESPERGDRPSVDGQPNAQETSAKVRGVKTPIELQIQLKQLKMKHHQWKES